MLHWGHVLVTLLVCSTQAWNRDGYIPCYYPNGDLEPWDLPCSPDGGACCQAGWACAANGLCWLPRGDAQFQRRSCTDKNWGALCPSLCINSSTINQAANASICYYANRMPAEVCSGNAECCGDHTLARPAGNISMYTTLGNDISPTWRSVLDSMRSATDVSASPTTSLPPSQTISSIDTSQTSSSSANSTTSSGSPHQRPVSTIVGTTVGVSLGLAALALVLYILRRRHSQVKAHKVTSEHGQAFPADHHRAQTKNELAANSNSIAEMPSDQVYSELDNSIHAKSNPRDYAEKSHWSVVPSLAPPPVEMPATNEVLQVDSQPYYHAARGNNLPNSGQHGSRMLPVSEVAGVAVPSGSRIREGSMHESAGRSSNTDESTTRQQCGTIG